MSFKLYTLVTSADGRINVTLRNLSADTTTTVWVTPGQPIDNLTIAQIEELARQEAAKLHAR